MVFARSSNCKTNLDLSNAVGVIDSGYRGEVTLKFRITHNVSSYIQFLWQNYVKKMNPLNVGIKTLSFNDYKIGDRVGQIIILPYPSIEFEEVKELSETERGTGGYGSSGR